MNTAAKAPPSMKLNTARRSSTQNVGLLGRMDRTTVRLLVWRVVQAQVVGASRRPGPPQWRGVHPHSSTYNVIQLCLRKTSCMRKTIYVKDADAALWARAEAFAKARRLPMSSLILLAVEEYLAEHETSS